MNNRATQLSALVIAIAVACSGCNNSSNDTPARKVDSHLERAESYRRQGQYRAAIIEARNAMDAAPQDQRGTLELATLLNELNQGKLAQRVLEPLSNSTDRAIIIARADSLLSQGKARSALEYLHAYKSDDADFQLRIAKAQAGAGLTTEAQATLARLENTALATQARLLQAQLFLQQENIGAAQNILEQLLQKDPNFIDALTLSAKIAEKRGDLEGAESFLSRALIILPQTDVITPSKAEVLQQLIPILTKLGRSSESLVYAKALADADPQGTLLQDKFKQGLEAFKTGKFDEAENVLGEVYEQTHDEYAGLLLGMIKYNKKDYSNAAALLGENADPEIAPDTALKAFANAELNLGRPEKLLELIGPDAQKHIKDPELRALIGIALTQSGKRADGDKLLNDVLQENTANAAVRAIVARHYLISKQSDKAIKMLEEGLSKTSDSNLTRLLIGAYVQAGRLDDALRTAQNLAAFRPEQAANYQIFGHTALIAKDYATADKALQKALALQSDYAPALIDSANLHLIRKQSQPAADIYQRLIEKNANDIAALKGFIAAQELLGEKNGEVIENRIIQIANSDAAHAVIAEYYLHNNRTDDADRLLSKITIIGGNNYPAYVKQLYAIAQTNRFLKDKDFNRASQTAIDGLRLNPRNTNLLALLGYAAIGAGSNEEARKIIDQFAAIEPNSPALVDLRAAYALATNDATNAVQQLRTLWNSTRSDQTAIKLYQALAKIDPNAAAQFLSEWKTALPQSDLPWLLDGVQSEQNGDIPRAEKFYQEALSRNNNNALALNNLALILSAKKDSRALALAEKAYSLQPKNPAVLDTYGWILIESKQREKGIALLRQAAEIAPKVPQIAEHLKRAQESQ